jgi:hypothetical protein
MCKDGGAVYREQKRLMIALRHRQLSADPGVAPPEPPRKPAAPLPDTTLFGSAAAAVPEGNTAVLFGLAKSNAAGFVGAAPGTSGISVDTLGAEANEDESWGDMGMDEEEWGGMLAQRRAAAERCQTAFTLQTTKCWLEARYWMVCLRCPVHVYACECT